MHFTKMQGAGNDYVVVDGSGNHHNWSQLVQVICDRHYGVGCDSLLVLLPSQKAHFKMRVFDTDGSEAEMCGNGIRCLAKYVYEKGMVTNGNGEIQVETLSGVKKLKVGKKDGKVVRIQANMGAPRFTAAEVPAVIDKREGVLDINSMISYPTKIDGTYLRLNLVSMGNPHAVHFSDQPVSEFPLGEMGPIIEHLPIFPNRVNFEVARIISRNEIEVRVWERGVGETLACGTGACATTAAAHLLGYIDDKVDITLRGGSLQVEWNGDDGILLSGPAEIVYEGEWPEEV
ncbi:MAG: diaminopimelate epimerase [Dehalococcoidales bacterium]|nr:diaminopimelate epimerase [Dehalococcoidales bacterium]